jgi:hypothetical protein
LRAVAALALLVSGGCHRDALPTQGTPETSVAAGASTAPATSLSPTEDARRIVSEWSDAIDRHDLGALEGLYAEQVRFYGKELSRSAVLQSKKAALTTDAFRQQIVGDIEVTPREDGRIVAGFVKRSGVNGKTSDIRAKLVVGDRDGAALAIVEETDEVTEQRETETPRATCAATAERVVNALPDVKRALKSAKDAADRSQDRAHFGGLGPLDDDQGGFTMELGVHTAERFEAYVFYAVDRAGHLSVTVSGSDEVIPPAARSAVERACAH